MISFDDKTKKFILKSKDGKRVLGKFDTRQAANEREAEITKVLGKQGAKSTKRKSFS